MKHFSFLKKLWAILVSLFCLHKMPFVVHPIVSMRLSYVYIKILTIYSKKNSYTIYNNFVQTPIFCHKRCKINVNENLLISMIDLFSKHQYIMDCLIYATLYYIMFRSCNQGIELCVGIRKSEDEALLSHAWIILDSGVIKDIPQGEYRTFHLIKRWHANV